MVPGATRNAPRSLGRAACLRVGHGLLPGGREAGAPISWEDGPWLCGPREVKRALVVRPCRRSSDARPGHRGVARPIPIRIHRHRAPRIHRDHHSSLGAAPSSGACPSPRPWRFPRSSAAALIRGPRLDDAGIQFRLHHARFQLARDPEQPFPRRLSPSKIAAARRARRLGPMPGSRSVSPGHARGIGLPQPVHRSARLAGKTGRYAACSAMASARRIVM